MRWHIVASAFAVIWLGVGAARAQISDNVVKIGVMNDQSGLYADLGGPGSVVAAKMAVEDFGGSVLGKPVEVVFADHQNKSDVGAAIARKWFETGGVDMAIGFDNSAVALANGGGDMVNTIKQANEFGLAKKQSLVSMLVFISDVHSMQLQAAQGLKFVTAFYWDRDDDTRAWSKRFFDKQGRMPTMAQASVDRKSVV